MSLFIASLNSGSNGNCYYIGNGDEAVFIDAGLSCRETELRMKRLGLNMSRIKAIFISHEHSDHIDGVAGLVAKYQIPVYFSQSTLKKAGFGKITSLPSNPLSSVISALRPSRKYTTPVIRTVLWSALQKQILAFLQISGSPVIN
jgi:phosphoribosyl 1,2-cyclic phosphodiesterase